MLFQIWMKHVAFLVEDREGIGPDIYHSAKIRKQNIRMPRLINHFSIHVRPT